MKRFEFEFPSAKPADTVRRELLQAWTGPLAGWGYDLTSQSDVGVTFSRKYRRWYLILLAVCLFPIGLLFLLVSETAVITATIDPDQGNGGSVLAVSGTAPKKVAGAFATLEV
jgi:hypothetical protein